MEIFEVACGDSLESLMTIIRTHQSDEANLNAARTQLIKEVGEIGGNRLIYIAKDNDLTVAMVQLLLNKADNDPDLANGQEIAHVHNLQVRNELQGRGIGFQLMQFTEQKAKDMGKTTLTLGVDDGNDNAIHLYKKLGYETFKEYEGRTPDERGYYMKKSL